MDTLPPELINYIFNYLTQHDLTSLSLVCRPWSLITLPRLYYSPRLTTPDQLNRFAYTQHRLKLIAHLDLSAIGHHVTDKHLHHFYNNNNDNTNLSLSLSYINLTDCDKISTHVLNQLIQRSIHTLHTVILINCKLNLETLKLLRQASSLFHLIKLDLSGTMILPCHAIDTPNHLENLIEANHSKLQELNVGGCNWVDSQTVANIARGLPKLIRLGLFWCDQVYFTSCLDMVQQLDYLEYLDLQHIPAINSQVKAMSLLDHGGRRLKFIEYSDKLRKTVLQKNKIK